MMKVLKIVAIVLSVALVSFLLYRNIPFFPPPTRTNEGKILLSTHWMGSGDYVKFSPELNTHGCWSTTFAQIAYYHRIQPSGISNYECSKGYKIYENLNNHKFDWTKFRNEITDSTSQDAINEISLYCYYIATIVQKDFGTGRYITRLPPIKNIEKQLNVKANLYFNYKGIFQSKRKMKNIIMREIEANRPMFLYYRNMNVKGSGHAVVLDGYRINGKDFEVHLNFGWGGRNDGWYNLFKSIATEGDTELRILITVQPISKN
ncbi:MAG: C10 family peptidase [Candidatus Helarchaeota archaeon]